MKKHLLLGAVALSFVGSIFAQEEVVYEAFAPQVMNAFEEYESVLGTVFGVSPNGRYAAITDDENNLSYLWNSDDPGEMKELARKGTQKTNAFDVNDEGMVVGQVYLYDGIWRPAYFTEENNKWTMLDVPDYVYNTAFAYRISNDGKYIGGIVCVVDEGTEIGKGYRPIRWVRNDAGEYEYEVYTNLPESLRGHQGFWMQDMSEDGNYIFGYVMCASMQAEIPVFYDVKEGKFCYFNEVVMKYETWMYKGKYEGRDENGNQIWLEDINDPRVSKYPYYTIDGYKDYSDQATFHGTFAYYDDDTQTVYGFRTNAVDVDEDGNGRLERGAFTFDMNTLTFTDNFEHANYTCASNDVKFIGTETIFGTAKVLKDGKLSSVSDFFDVDLSYYDMEDTDDNGNPKLKAYQIASFNDVSKNLDTVGGMHYVVNPATGDPQYLPIIIRKVAGSGVDQVVENNNVELNINNGVITSNVAAEVFALNGAKVAEGNNITVAPGLYIVKAGTTVKKVLVK